MTAEIDRLPPVYASRRQFSYVIVREPDSFILYKAYTDNCGTVRLAEFKTKTAAEEFVNDLPAARRVWL
jgi:hypothetical protein